MKAAPSKRQTPATASFSLPKTAQLARRVDQPDGSTPSRRSTAVGGGTNDTSCGIRTFSGLQPEKYASLKRKQAGGGVHFIEKIKNLSFWPPKAVVKKLSRQRDPERGKSPQSNVDDQQGYSNLSIAEHKQRRMEKTDKLASECLSRSAESPRDLHPRENYRRSSRGSSSAHVLANLVMPVVHCADITASKPAVIVKKRHEDRFIDVAWDANNNNNSRIDEGEGVGATAEYAAAKQRQNASVGEKQPSNLRGGGENLDLFRKKLNFFRLDEPRKNSERVSWSAPVGEGRVPDVDDTAQSIWAQRIKTGAVNQISKRFVETKPGTEIRPIISVENVSNEPFDILKATGSVTLEKVKNDENLQPFALSRGRLAHSLRRPGGEKQQAGGKRLSYSVDSKSEYHFSSRPSLKSGVGDLARRFESGDMDRLGPLKLYHTQAHKRELEKILASNQGSVLYKAQIYDGSPASGHTEESFDREQPSIPSSQQSFSLAKRQDSFMRAILHSDARDHPINDEESRDLDRKTRRGSYMMATSSPNRANLGPQQNREQPQGDRGDSPMVDDQLKSERRQSIFECKPSDWKLSIYTSAVVDRKFSQPTNQKSRLSTVSSSTGAEESLTNSTATCFEGSDISAQSGVDGQSPTSPLTSKQTPRMQKLFNFFINNEPVSNQQDKHAKYVQSSIGQQTDRMLEVGVSSLKIPSPALETPTTSGSAAESWKMGSGSRLSESSQSILGSPSTIGAPSSGSMTFCLPVDGILIDGPLVHKQQATRSRKFSERVWRHYWAVLHNCKIYLCRRRPVVDSTNSMLTVTEVSDNNVMDVESCIADIAYDYSKRKNVFRVSTQNQAEHLFQAPDSETMVQWLRALQRCSGLDENLDYLPGSMALIVKRYAAQSQSVSPTIKPKRQPSGYSNQGATAKKYQDVDLTVGAEREPPEDRYAGEGCSRFEPEDKSAQKILTASAEKYDKREKVSAAAPSKHRKWRKIKKTGSCPLQTPKRPDLPISEDSVFGQYIEDCATSSETDFIPILVKICVKIVEHYGLNVVGVYRIPGNTTAVNTLISSLNYGFENIDFDDTRWRDVNVVSSTLKAFFRRLPDPLLTDRLYQQFIDANRIERQNLRLKKIRETIKKLPRSNYETVKFLISHLRKIAQYSHTNKMEARNLALMFGPSLLRHSGDSMTMMVSHMSDQCKIIETLILYYDWIFCLGSSSTLDSASNERTPSPPSVELEQTKECLISASFSEMNDLLCRVTKAERNVEKTKDNIVKTIWKVKRGTRRPSKSLTDHPPEENVADEDDPPVQSSTTYPPLTSTSALRRQTEASALAGTPTLSRASNAGVVARRSRAFSDRDVMDVDLTVADDSGLTVPDYEDDDDDAIGGITVGSLPFRRVAPPRDNERDIDAEVGRRTAAARDQRSCVSSEEPDVQKLMMTSQSFAAMTSLDKPHGRKDDGADFRRAAEELRRLREQHIYTARRIFITGPNPTDDSTACCITTRVDLAPASSGGDPSSPASAPSSNPNGALTAALRKKPSLDISSLKSSLEVLSPATRAMVERFQAAEGSSSAASPDYFASAPALSPGPKLSTLPRKKTSQQKDCEPGDVTMTAVPSVTLPTIAKNDDATYGQCSAAASLIIKSVDYGTKSPASAAVGLTPSSAYGRQTLATSTSDYSSANESPCTSTGSFDGRRKFDRTITAEQAKTLQRIPSELAAENGSQGSLAKSSDMPDPSKEKQPTWDRFFDAEEKTAHAGRSKSETPCSASNGGSKFGGGESTNQNSIAESSNLSDVQKTNRRAGKTTSSVEKRKNRRRHTLCNVDEANLIKQAHRANQGKNVEESNLAPKSKISKFKLWFKEL